MSHNLATNKIAQMLDICIAKFLASKETFDLSQTNHKRTRLFKAWEEECSNGIGSVAEAFQEGTIKVHCYQAGYGTFRGFNVQFPKSLNNDWAIFIEALRYERLPGASVFGMKLGRVSI